MTFRTPKTRTVRWMAWDGCEEGVEHLDIRSDGGVLVATGVVVAAGERSFGLTYRLVIDDTWYVREAHLQTTSGHNLHLESDGRGAWRESGEARADLRDCTDIDIEATPFTNTLPIRRLGLRQDERAAIRPVYVRVPALTAEPGRQRYTALTPGALYRFESLDSLFRADLPVDPEGLVLDYPGLFRRII
ncbi:putative glycolipid-binding domain-containing protein [Microvirga aerophila]|uniref:Transcriptional regulator n=1 Tax=Microvirga aerophila TaxID=670291 RepID=A0A512BXX3_9HYPH|nr:putative glycolipid-binding domain-containing protein [Microvirga aerophila]GEO16798.1 transcriptional regulator [Microvirga aerophila]